MAQLDPSSDFERFRAQTERVWSHLIAGSGTPPGYCTHAFAPPTDVYERGDEVAVVIEIAGVRGSDVHLALDGRRLTISGIRHDHLTDAARRYTQMEVCRGEFERVLMLPSPVDVEGVRITYEDGFLRLTFSKATLAKRQWVQRRTP